MFQYIHVTINQLLLFPDLLVLLGFNTSMLLLIANQWLTDNPTPLFQYIHVTINLFTYPSKFHNKTGFNTSMLLLIRNAR